MNVYAQFFSADAPYIPLKFFMFSHHLDLEADMRRYFKVYTVIVPKQDGGAVVRNVFTTVFSLKY